MVEFYPLNLHYWLVYLLVLARMMGVVFLFPFFNWQGIPVILRVGIALMLAWLIYSSLSGEVIINPSGYLEVVLVLVKEVVVGLALGFLVSLCFSVFLNAGQLMDLGAGLTLSAVFSPQFGSQVTFLGQFYYLLVLVFFLGINGHHLFLAAVAESYQIIPMPARLLSPALAGGMGQVFGYLFALAFQIAAPVMVVLLIVDIALGLIAKTVPQVHVFVEGLPLKIALALVMLGLLLPLMVAAWESLLDCFSQYLAWFMEVW
ncbi:MAG TPA: flagellar biosynthetic protein FliR [Firmicutes bacterium]|nr:flagellar biosynthetic protein FliR [Bacillota bacterium]